MSTNIRHIKNVSGMQVPVQLKDGGTVYLLPGDSLANVVIENLPNISGMVEVHMNLNEVNPGYKDTIVKVEPNTKKNTKKYIK